jgi:subtilisin family serine protease
VIYFMGQEHFWNSAPMIFRLNDKRRDDVTPRDPAATSLVEETITDGLGQYALTVAAYSDTGDPLFMVPVGGITDFSSQGPLRDYSDPTRPPLTAKPDIAGPGDTINSAMSRHTEGWLHWPWWYWGARFEEMSGTSMASPMIAGVAALMLEKNPNLTVTQIRTALSSAPRAAVNPPTPPDSTNAYGVGRVDAMTSHSSTP